MKAIKSFILLLLLTGCGHAPSELIKVNKEINNYNYIPDTIDTWKTPQEFINDGGGDCEDFAITKHSMLTNYNKEILIVFNTYDNNFHALLVVNNKWVLDNVIYDVFDINSSQFKERYIKIYSTKQTTKPITNKDVTWFYKR